MRHDPALPRVYIWMRPLGLPVAIVGLLIVALLGAALLFATLAAGWRERFEAYVADQARVDAQAKISVVFESGALVCKVPPEKEPFAPAVHGACQALANELARLQKPAVVGRK